MKGGVKGGDVVVDVGFVPKRYVAPKLSNSGMGTKLILLSAILITTCILYMAPITIPLFVATTSIWVYRKNKIDEYYYNFPTSKESIAALNSASLDAFIQGAKAGKSIVAQLDSNIPCTPAFKEYKSYYAGLKARKDNNDALIAVVESSRFHLD